MIINQKLKIIAIFASLNFIVIASSDTGRESPLANFRGPKPDSNSALEKQVAAENSDVLVFNNESREEVGSRRDCSTLVLDNNATSPVLRVASVVALSIISPESNRDEKEHSKLEGQISGLPSGIELSIQNHAMAAASFNENSELLPFSLGESESFSRAQGVVALHLRSTGASVEDLSQQQLGQIQGEFSGLVTPNQ